MARIKNWIHGLTTNVFKFILKHLGNKSSETVDAYKLPEYDNLIIKIFVALGYYICVVNPCKWNHNTQKFETVNTNWRRLFQQLHFVALMITAIVVVTILFLLRYLDEVSHLEYIACVFGILELLVCAIIHFHCLKFPYYTASIFNVTESLREIYGKDIFVFRITLYLRITHDTILRTIFTGGQKFQTYGDKVFLCIFSTICLGGIIIMPFSGFLLVQVEIIPFVTSLINFTTEIFSISKWTISCLVSFGTVVFGMPQFVLGGTCFLEYFICINSFKQTFAIIMNLR